MIRHLEHSRTYPVALEEAFDRVLTVPLERVLGRRHLVVAGVSSTEPVDGSGAWGADGVGQVRTIRFSDGGSAVETLTGLDRARAFGYHLDGFTGLLKPLVGSIEGCWAFEPAGTGTRVTWSWDVTPASSVAGLGMGVFARLWAGVARQAFDELESHLVA